MKTPKLEEVKEYFKDAKEVKCVNFKNIKELINGVYKKDSTGFLYEFSNDYIRLYSHKNGYSEIITYKNNNIMKSDLSKVKVGDSIWTIQEGYGRITGIDNSIFPIKVGCYSYTLDGKYFQDAKHPSAFLTNPFIDEEFIKEAYSDACPKWQSKLKERFPEVFKSDLEVGKWYKLYAKSFNFKYTWFITKIENDIIFGYGFDEKNTYYEFESELISIESLKSFELATEQEVKEALINEAKKRGFEYRTNVLSVDNVKEIIGSGFFINSDGSFWNNGFSKNICLMRNGTWAEIIPTVTELSYQQIADKFGVNVNTLKIKK